MIESKVLFDGQDPAYLQNPKARTEFVVDNGTTVTLTLDTPFPFGDFQILMVRGSDEAPVMYNGTPIVLGTNTPVTTIGVPGRYVLDFPNTPVPPIDLVVCLERHREVVRPSEHRTSGGGASTVTIPPMQMAPTARTAGVSFVSFGPGKHNNVRIDWFDVMLGAKNIHMERRLLAAKDAFIDTGFGGQAYLYMQPHLNANPSTYMTSMRPRSRVVSAFGLNPLDPIGTSLGKLPGNPYLRSDTGQNNYRGAGLGIGNGPITYSTLMVPKNVHLSFLSVGLQ